MTFAQHALLVEGHNGYHDPKARKSATEQGTIADLLAFSQMRVG